MFKCRIDGVVYHFLQFKNNVITVVLNSRFFTVEHTNGTETN